MIDATQGVDMLMGAGRNAMSALSAGLDDYRMQRSFDAAVNGYNAIVKRYNSLLNLSNSVTGRLENALKKEKTENARLRALLATFNSLI